MTQVADRASRSQAILRKLLFQDGEDTSQAVIVEGAVSVFGFHPGRLEEAKPEIEELLHGLPAGFYEKGGGGWTFLNLCNDSDGNQWGEHPDMEALCCIAIGAKPGQWILMKQRAVLPGGLPYFQIFGEVR